MTFVKLYNDDCLKQLPKIKDKVDLVIVDLPYAQTACKWDCMIDLKQMWIELKKICKRDCVYVFFCTTKFGYKLIQSNEKFFRYDLIWEKSRKVGFLSANKMPLRKHEMMYVFADSSTDDIDNDRNLGLRAYAEKVKNYINKPIKTIDKDVGNQGIHHFYSFKSTQFELPTEKTYNILIDKYNLREMEGFREHKSLTDEWEKILEPTYNAQKVEGKPYKTKGGDAENYYRKEGTTYSMTGVENKGDRHPTSILHYPEVPDEQEQREHSMMYVFKEKGGCYNPQKVEGKPYKAFETKNNKQIGEVYGGKSLHNENKGDRHPTSVLHYPDDGKVCDNVYKAPVIHYTDSRSNIHAPRHPTSIVKFNNPKKSLHRTQKPVDLIEWLIKSYSNEGDVVLDYTMGSGSTGIACLNTGRSFIGIEKDPAIFKIAKDRLLRYEIEEMIFEHQLK